VRFWLGLFFLGAALNITIGAPGWPAVFAGNLADPDSYMRLERLMDGIHAGHLTNIVARDDSGAGVLVEWSRLMDFFCWALALPLAAVIGWRHALFAAGVAMGPAAAGLLGVTLAFAAERFVLRNLLWVLPVSAALLPALANYAAPGVVTHHVLLLALIALTAGLAVRAWDGDGGWHFLAGMSGGFAVWLTPETFPFIMLCYGVLLLRWLEVPEGSAMAACGAGFFDVLGFGLAMDPPVGGYSAVEIDRLSVVFAALGLAVFFSGVVLWRLQKLKSLRYRRAAGVAAVVLLLAAWASIFPQVLRGPYGLMSAADARLFFAQIQEMQPAAPDVTSFAFLFPGMLGVVIALARAVQSRDWRWWYVFACLCALLVLGIRFLRFAPVSSAAAAVVVAIALTSVSVRFLDRPALAAGARIFLLLLLLLVPRLPAMAHVSKPGPAGPNCDLHAFAPALGVAAGKIVLADVNETPELLWRSQILTVGSLYHHGVAGFLRLRAAWRAAPGNAEPPEVAATGAQYVLFCSGAGRTDLVADLPQTTLWDALLAGHPPAWLSLAAEEKKTGWRLYKILHG
jgi:hypothetical protein